MLGSLTGTITGRVDQRILVEVAGVGYWVHTGSWQPEGAITCYLHHHVREDASLLYGFHDLLTLTFFERLISVSGIGPKAALALLSLGSTARVHEAVESADVAFLSSAPGIGSKAAQKIILELRGKLPLSAGTTGTSHQDVLAALESLGYRAADIRPLVDKLPAEHTAIDAQIRWVLQQLA
jgi:Holliday junction DNA helicase RuvA